VLSGTQLAREVGEMLLQVVFGNDESLYHANDPKKSASINKLAQQPGMADAQWGHTRLSNSVGVFLLSRDLGGFDAYPHLLVTHYVHVLGLDLAKQKSLLAQAESNRWTVAQLAKAAGKGGSGGHHVPTAQTEFAMVTKMVTGWEDPKSGLCALATAAGLGADDTTPLSQLLSDLGVMITSMEDRLKGKAQDAMHKFALEVIGKGKMKPAKPAIVKKPRAQSKR
jgi:hypothetical protein